MPDQPGASLPLEQRQQIFSAVVEAQDAGMAVPASRADVARRFGITERLVEEIEREGLTHQWPPL
jgi:hypothetical protein